MNNTLNKTSIFEIATLFCSGVVLLFIVAPVVGIFLDTTGQQVIDTVKDTEIQDSITLTLGVSMAGTICCSLFAVPFAYFLARKNFCGKTFITGVVNVPVTIPHSAAGIALLGFISRDSVIGQIADYFGYNLVGNPIAIAIAMSFVSIPFLINAARDGFIAVPVRLEKAALNLGASPFRVFVTISLPLAFRSILSGFVMMWARGLSEFGAVVVVAYHPMVSPVLIYERFTSFGLKYARPVSAVFIMICLVIFIVFRLFIEKREVGRNNA